MKREDAVVIIDSLNRELGAMEKLEAHKRGILHRSVSVFLINEQGEWLLQRRSEKKYHSAGLWSNSCCTHPYCDETTQEAAKRRVAEELGIKNVSLNRMFEYLYCVELNDELTEHELDVVYVGYTNEMPQINHDEVMQYRYATIQDIEQDLIEHSEKYTIWFKRLFPKVKAHLLA